jgi:hypothetical protein
MKRLIAAMGLAAGLALFATPSPVQAADCPATNPCVTLQGSDVVVVVLGREVARVPAPVKTVKVSVPGPTVVVPSPVPGPVRTVTVTSPVPGPVRTVYVSSPAPGKTQGPVPVNSPVGQSPTPRATLTPEPTPSPSRASLPDGSKAVPKERVVVTKIQAAGISALLIGLTILAGVVLYLFGRMRQRAKDREAELDRFRHLRDELLERD